MLAGLVSEIGQFERGKGESELTYYQVDTWERENILKCHVRFFRRVHGKERISQNAMYVISDGYMGKREYPEMPCTLFGTDTWERENILKCHVRYFGRVHGKERFS